MIPGLPSAGFALGAVLLALTGSVTGYIHGRNVEAGERAKSDLAADRLAEAIAADKRRRVAALSEQLEKARAQRRVVERIITKEVARYVEVTPAADRCNLPGTWRLRHDAAATGTPLADSARLADAAAGAVSDATALATIADNYAECREWREQLVGWQRWWSEVSRLGVMSCGGADSIDHAAQRGGGVGRRCAIGQSLSIGDLADVGDRGIEPPALRRVGSQVAGEFCADGVEVEHQSTRAESRGIARRNPARICDQPARLRHCTPSATTR